MKGICPVDGIKSLTDFINFFTCLLLDAIVPLLVALAIAGFVYGIIKYFINPDNEEKRKEGKSFMLWGLIGMFVIFTFWAIIGIFSNTFFQDGNKSVLMPGLPESQSK